MNVVNAGNRFQIYGEDIKTSTALPVGAYELAFNKMQGFFLISRNDLNIGEEKIYGTTPRKVAKVINSFSIVERNFGVILSGQKGIGKTLFARVVAAQAKEIGLPLIVVPFFVPGIASFIGSIEQKVVILFDEFEKTFRPNDDMNPQDEMLSLFDGIDGGKKLFIITCNEVNQLNDCLLNRPGRFHYHFIMKNPDSDEIKEYMTDKLKPEHHNVIDKVICYSMYTNLTYDHLRAIAFEINNGYSLGETFEDLNIGAASRNYFDFEVQLENGEIFKSLDSTSIVIGSDFRNNVWVNSVTNPRVAFRINYRGTDVRAQKKGSLLSLDVNQITTYIDENDFDIPPFNMSAEEWSVFCLKVPIKSIVLKKYSPVSSEGTAYSKFLDTLV